MVAELVDWSVTWDLFRGLHFPNTDIPAQARELYKLNTVRILYDREQSPTRLVGRTHEDIAVPLDMTHTFLRAMSPVHLQYLANMGVRASMSISIIASKKLWGLISCHSYGPHGMRVSFPRRNLCRLVGEIVSGHVDRIILAQQTRMKEALKEETADDNPGRYFTTKSEDLLSFFDADFGVLFIGEHGRILGSVKDSQKVMVVSQYLRMKCSKDILVSTCLSQDVPEIGDKLEWMAGYLLVPLSWDGRDFIAFFRKEQLQEVRWAGNPHNTKTGTQPIMPRKSFNVWCEKVAGKCRDWESQQLEIAVVLRLVFRKYIEVWREKEMAFQNSRLASLLLSNASHAGTSLYYSVDCCTNTLECNNKLYRDRSGRATRY